MKVAVYRGVGSIELEERPKPQAGPGEVIVKVKYCGICGADVHSYRAEGQWTAGVVFGHEIVGTVAELGSGVAGWSVGDRVAVMPLGACGECYYCRKGHPNVCVHFFDLTIGISPENDGGFAEFVRVRNPKTMLHRIPAHLAFEDAVLVEPLATAVAGVRKSIFRVGDDVLVVGAGAIGLFAVQLLKMAGARHITVLNRSAAKRQLALEFGANAAFSPTEEGDALYDKVLALHGGLGADVAFECAGVPEAIRMAVDLVKYGNQVLILGGSEKTLPVREQDLVMREIDLKAIQAYSDEFALALDFVAQGRIATKPMLTDIIRLDDIVEKGFNRLTSSSDGIKIIVAP